MVVAQDNLAANGEKITFFNQDLFVTAKRFLKIAILLGHLAHEMERHVFAELHRCEDCDVLIA